MNKIEAHELSLELWTWLADNPGKEKYSWKRIEEIVDLNFLCPLCEYYGYGGQTYKSVCENCCLKGCVDSSDYSKWVRFINDNYDEELYNEAYDKHLEAAGNIRDTIKAKLEKLKK